jgi:hypothetical protein
VEEGAYRPDTTTTTVPAPLLTAVSSLLVWDSTPPPQEIFAGFSRWDPFAHPLDWVTNWQFVQRAALSPRAP